jgi:hypothetical protein
MQSPPAGLVPAGHALIHVGAERRRLAGEPATR